MPTLTLKVPVEFDEAHEQFMEEIEAGLDGDVLATDLLAQNIAENIDVEPLIYQARQQVVRQQRQDEGQQTNQQALQKDDVSTDVIED